MHSPIGFRYKSLQQDDIAEIARIYKRRLLAQRIRRVAKVAIIATKTNTSYRKRKLLFLKRRLQANLRIVQQNQYRLVAGGFVLVLAVSTFVAPFIQANSEKPVVLSREVNALVGESRDDAKDYLKYDSNKKLYSFEAPKQEETTNYAHTGRNADAYTSSLPSKAGDGVTVTEQKTNIAVTLTPDFFTTPAKKSDGNHLVYQSGNKQVIYTHKFNGLKEDIIIPRFQGPSLEYDFKLTLPSGVEARLDQDGNIGIYSADTTLYGDISFGSDEDRARVDKARENGEKTNLVMTIPYPIVKDSTGTEFTDRANFELGNKTIKQVKAAAAEGLPADAPKQLTQTNKYSLTLRAYSLRDLKYPISLDPTMQVTSSADFSRLNTENASIDTTNNLIKRSSLTGGTLNSWATDDTTLPSSGQHAAQAYNGYLYWLNHGANVYYAPIASDGSIGSYVNSNIAPGSFNRMGTAIYNGYLYVSGAEATDGNTVRYAKINTNGSIGSFSSTAGFSTARQQYGFTAYNGYMYVSGGAYQTGCPILCAYNYLTDTQYAPIRADGSLGSWASAGSAFTNGRRELSLLAYNNRLYVTGGRNDSTGYADVQYVLIDTNGTIIGSWAATASMNTGRTDGVVVALSGYMYATAGFDSNSSSEYAAIYADGSLGTWRTTTSIATGRGGPGGAVSNGRIYVSGGCTSGCGTQLNDVQYTSVKPAGETGAFANTTSLGTARAFNSTTVYNGYIYVAGGCTNNSGGYATCATPTATVEYASISSSGTLGSWATTTSLSVARWGHAAVAFNDFLYVVNGCTTIVGACTHSNTVTYASINSNGTLGASWNLDATHTTSVARRELAAVAVNGFLYSIGGYDGATSGATNKIEYSALNENGTLNNFTTSSVNLPAAMSRLAAFAHGKHLYIGHSSLYSTVLNTDGSIGSSWHTDSLPFSLQDGAMTTNNGFIYISRGTSVSEAPFNADGSATSFTTVASTNTGHNAHGLVAYNSYLYAVAGCSTALSSASCNNIGSVTEYAQINNGGSGISSSGWTTSTSMMTARRDFAYAQKGDRVYVAGGCINTCAASEVTAAAEIGQFSTDGSITWTSTTSLPKGIWRTSGTIVGDYFYVIGGLEYNGAETTVNTAYYAKILTDGTLSGNSCGTSVTWCSATTLPRACGLTQSTNYNGYIYTAAGYCGDTPRHLYYAKTNSDGTLGAWSSGTNLPYDSFWAGSLQAVNNTLYYIGGCEEATCITHHGNTATANLASDGSVGSTWAVSGDIPGGRRTFATALYGGFIYALGGEGGGTPATTSVVNDAGVGSWQKTSTGSMCTYFSGGAAVYNGRLYNLAGQTTGPSATTCYTPINVIPRKAQVSKLYDFDVGVKPTKLITRGTKHLGAVVGVSYSTNNAATGSVTLDNAQTIFDTGYAGSNAQPIALGTNRTLSRYLFLRYTVDDAQSAFFPDAGNESTITDFDMYYTANPGSRLRGGRTFTNGADRGLDASPQ